MKKILIVMSCIFVPFNLFPLKKGSSQSGVRAPVFSGSNVSSNGLLIFLDDLQGDAGVSILARAISEKASPLIVSASLISQIYQDLDEAQYDIFKERCVEITTIPSDKITQEQMNEYFKKMAIATAQFNAQTARQWIIKEISPSLYLLLHESYVAQKRLSVELVRRYDEPGPLTLTELELGLKVNHMKTVNASDIKKSDHKSIFASYFTDALKENTIFVTNAEYLAQFESRPIAWSILMVGHGSPRAMIAGISLADFGDFLSFLENKITTKLLYYVSCFSGGANESLLYATSQQGVNKTYPFAIITQSFTDSSVGLNSYQINFREFLQHVITSDCIDYFALAGCINSAKSLEIENRLPKIKFPGLEWFSVIDDKKVVSIGSVLAKTRTQPLTIGMDSKEGPVAILLYTRDIPFELKINGGGSPGVPPQIISMVPGDALHTIKRISSSVYSMETLTQSISSFKALGAHKTFVIGEMEGIVGSSSVAGTGVASSISSPHTTKSQLREWVVVDRYRDKKLDYLFFRYGDKSYSMSLSQTPLVIESCSAVLSQRYLHILQYAVKRRRTLLFEQAKKFFEKQHASFAACIPTITDFYFPVMPQDYVLYIPKLMLSSKITDMNALADALGTTLCQIEKSEGKQIWFEEMMVEGERVTPAGISLRLGVAKDGSKSFVSSANFSKEISCGRLPVQRVETIPTPAAEKAIETSSIHTHTTEDTVKVLTGLLAKKEALEAYLREYLQDAFRKGTEWIKRGEKWVQAQPSLRE